MGAIGTLGNERLEMTLRQRMPIVCECGHEGAILMAENDQPYSKIWESYTLEGFNGGSLRVEGLDEAGNLFEALKPSCPKCSSTRIKFFR